MSAASRYLHAFRADGDAATRRYHVAALASVAGVVGASLAVLYHVVDVVGGVELFLAVVVGSVALGTATGRTLGHRQAFAVAVLLLVVGLAGYLSVVPASYFAVMSASRFVADMAALLTGFSILQMTQAGAWAIGVAAGPTFLATYFAVRGEYVRAATVGALTLGFFVLTGDSGTVGTLLGVVGTVAAAGFSSLARFGGRREQIEVLAVAVAVMILASATVTAVPGGERSPILPGGTPSVQSELVSDQPRSPILGSIRLSPKVRFVVESERPAYWRVGAYDRFTGYGWVRSGGTEPFAEQFDYPPGERAMVEQTFTASQALDALPAAAEPVDVDGVEALVTQERTLTPANTIDDGERFTVTSLVQNASVRDLRTATGDYPDRIRERYLQLPESTPDRVVDLAGNVTDGARTPYAKAVRVESWLEVNKGYTLSVERPTRNIADAFLFEMDAGYCTYFATTMVAMLRSQGVPARYALGYTSGQRVAEDEWVVRGLDSHAWVEVWIPDQGWVTFDPTPAQPRTEEEDSRVAEARSDDVEGVDAAGSEQGTWTPPTSSDTLDLPNITVTADGSELPDDIPPEVRRELQPGMEADEFQTTLPADPVGNVTDGSDSGPAPPSTGDDGPELPPPEVLLVWLLVGVGVLAGLRRLGALDRAYRALWLRVQPPGSPAETVEGAFARVEYALAERYRPRRPNETVRAYLQAVGADDRARRVAAIRERARYAGHVSGPQAAEARTTAAAVVDGGNGLATVFNRLVSYLRP